ncbi:MAG TPA: D-2-hydroxyacid dehydrogenase [Herpetosiphonaceae bacterium]|nr:D-2-hydroxyacid dehydrogenase [Herpetosiphonaceae bacterium]
MNTLLLALDPAVVPPDALERIGRLAPGLRVAVTRDRAEIEALLDSVEIAAGSLPPDLAARAPALRWYQQWAAGSDWLLRHPEAVERDFLLTSASGVHAVPISEQIIGALLMFARGLHRAVRAQSRGEWWRPEMSELFELPGKTMLVIGVGAIGARTAELASALGMRVEGLRRHPERPLPGVAAMYGPDQLRERLAYADVVVLTVPLSAETRGMIGPAELDALKPGAYLINIGRGGTVDEPALIHALRSGRLAGAALDVFAEEPLPADSPLWSLDQLILTAHYSGATPHYDERALAIFLDNLERFRAGQPLRNLVDKASGY